VRDELFEDNTRCWSGDHCGGLEIVPGVLFTSVALDDGRSDWRTSDRRF
jgi:hypothetical protein